MAWFERDSKGVMHTHQLEQHTTYIKGNAQDEHGNNMMITKRYMTSMQNDKRQCNITMMSMAYATNKRNNAKQDNNGKHTMPKKQNTRMEWHYREHGNNQMKYTTSTK